MFRRITILVGVLACFGVTVNGQVRPVNDYGALGLARLLKQLQTTASVMMIGAHPDDEDSALLAYLARGENARTAYLSLTRGDGGQNIIGPELSEPLGIIRTEELLQARRLDGAEQYFTRAFDYGFSKTLDETKSKWPEDVIKCDVVRAIRLFRPLVVISRFTGIKSDGHGQHQYAGYITPIAVKAAADPQACSDAGQPWQVAKFYVEHSSSDNSQPTLRINTGQYDPVLGRTYFEIAMEGRSQHRSQGEGRIEFHGDQFSKLSLIGPDKGKPETSIFDGLDTSVTGIRSPAGNSEEAFRQKLVILRSYIEKLSATPSLGELAAIYQAAYDAKWSTRQPVSKAYLREVERNAANALKIAAGIQIDALSESDTVVAGDEVTVSAKVFSGIKDVLSVSDISLTVPSGWTVAKTDPPGQNNAGFNTREVAVANVGFKVKVDRSAPLTQPYWLTDPRDGDLFRWSKSPSRTLPFDPQQLVAIVRVKIGETDITFEQPVQYRFADPARGEIRREVNVVPALSVAVDRGLLVVPKSNKPQTRRLVVTVANNTGREQTGNVSLNIAVDPQWKVASPNGSAFSLKAKGAKASIPFEITIPANTSARSVAVRASANVGDASYALTMSVVAYPHIQTHRYYTPADAKIESIDLKTRSVNVGYVMGSGDEVPEAIRQMGMSATLLAEEDLASGDLSKFVTIVVGIRASETRDDLVANNGRLLEYVRNGGTVIMQYQRNNFVQSGLAPYKIDTTDKQGTAAGSIARVVDENAPVKILDPAHPVFNFPNKITAKDFEDWVQERNAYNLVTFVPQYTPLLESHDAGEQENKGGLVIAKFGKGNWVYCSYSFFRQLPAGVPGAYRLFANLLSLPKAK